MKYKLLCAPLVKLIILKPINFIERVKFYKNMDIRDVHPKERLNYSVFGYGMTNSYSLLSLYKYNFYTYSQVVFVLFFKLSFNLSFFN